ncbi:hypothetical protein U1Q18_049286, partial [Sarracenia purpurea var. burkii]
MPEPRSADQGLAIPGESCHHVGEVPAHLVGSFSEAAREASGLVLCGNQFGPPPEYEKEGSADILEDVRGKKVSPAAFLAGHSSYDKSGKRQVNVEANKKVDGATALSRSWAHVAASRNAPGLTSGGVRLNHRSGS